MNQIKILYDSPPRVMEIKTKVNKWGLISFKSFCTAKETISKVKKQPLRKGDNNSKWNSWQRINFQNIQAAHITQHQENKQPNQKVEKRPRHFSKDIQMANKHMKRCSTSLIIRDMQIKTTMRYYLTLVRMALIKKSTNKCWRGCGEKGTLLHFWWECKLVEPLWKTVWRFL